MYLEIDEGFPKHRKTLRLRSIMRDPKAGWYMVDLWTWACRSCPDGDLTGISAYEIEEAANYPKCDGKLCQAMIDAGFIDADSSGAPAKLHNWMGRTGAAIKKMEGQAEKKRLYRAHRDGKCDRQSCEWCKTVQGQSKDSPQTGSGTSDTDQSRPVQTSQVKTRPDQRSEGEPPPVVSAKIRPRNAHDLIHCLRVAIQREQPQNGPWSPGGHFAHSDADSFLRNLGDVEEALATIEARIELFAKDASMLPWDVAKFVKAFNGIGQPKHPQNSRQPQVTYDRI